MNRLPRLLALLCLLLLTAGTVRAETWQPAHTYAFVVGVLEWKDTASLPSFPKAERRDARLVRLLRERGVPADHIVYLPDKAATRQAVLTALPRLLSRTQPGDMLLVFYCGHGYLEPKNGLFFATYDVEGETPGWQARELIRAIETGFKGRRALLTGDCCYSGGMASVIQEKPRRVAYACLASSLASETSTGAWTFTESLLDGLSGSAWVDANHDGAVTVAELGRYVGSEMLFGDEQRATAWISPSFGDAFTLATTRPRLPSPRIGDHVLATSGGKQWKGKIVEINDDKFRIHYYGWNDADDEWLPSSALAPPSAPATRFAVGAAAEVEWKGTWWPAHVLKTTDGLYYVHYDSYDDIWNEWVSNRRIRPIPAK